MEPETKKKIYIGLAIGAAVIVGGILISKLWDEKEKEDEKEEKHQEEKKPPTKPVLRTREPPKQEVPQPKPAPRENVPVRPTQPQKEAVQPKPTILVTIPKDRLVEIYKKLALKNNLIQVDVFRRVRGKTQEQIRSNPDLLSSMSKAEQQQKNILIEQGLGSDGETAANSYNQAISQYKTDPEVRSKMQKIDSHYAYILNKYRSKMQSNKITEDELNQLEDELIYSDQL